MRSPSASAHRKEMEDSCVVRGAKGLRQGRLGREQERRRLAAQGARHRPPGRDGEGGERALRREEAPRHERRGDQATTTGSSATSLWDLHVQAAELKYVRRDGPPVQKIKDCLFADDVLYDTREKRLGQDGGRSRVRWDRHGAGVAERAVLRRLLQGPRDRSSSGARAWEEWRVPGTSTRSSRH